MPLLAGVQEAGGLKKVLFDRAYAAKKAALADGKNTHPLWDRLIFSKIAEKVGLNKVRVMITGSAPIADHVLDFLRIVFACPVFEGYGLSETSGAGTVTADGDLAPGTVGAVLSCNELRCARHGLPSHRPGSQSGRSLHSLSELQEGSEGRRRAHRSNSKAMAAERFASKEPMSSKAITRCQRRLRRPLLRACQWIVVCGLVHAKAVDEDGWFHSGDIGMWLPDGRLKIIDRKKNIFKLAQGEYVSPEKIEGLNVQSSFVAQSFVYGDSLKTQLVAVVVPDPDTAATMSACGVKEAATLLGVVLDAPRRDIESAFRRRALRCHPDRHPKDALAKMRFLRLSRAKELLLQRAVTSVTSATTGTSTRGSRQASAGSAPFKND
eukprot:g13069.t1